MAAATVETFRCMMCGHQYQEPVEKGEDKERSCPKCRSNSIRHLRKKVTGPQASAAGKDDAADS